MEDSLEVWKEKLESLIDSQRSNYRIANFYNIKDFDIILNTQMQAGIVMLDIMIPLLHIKRNKSKYENLFYIRILVVVIKDYFDDISTILGKDLIEELILNGFDSNIEEVKNINKAYSDLRKKHKIDLDFFRNNILAHKTKDSLKYLYLLDSMDTIKFTNLAIEMLQNTQKLFMCCSRLTDLIIEKIESNKKDFN